FRDLLHRAVAPFRGRILRRVIGLTREGVTAFLLFPHFSKLPPCARVFGMPNIAGAEPKPVITTRLRALSTAITVARISTASGPSVYVPVMTGPCTEA